MRLAPSGSWRPTTMSDPTPAQQLGSFLAKFDPRVAASARAALAQLRKKLPGAIELVYDNYNALAIGRKTYETVLAFDAWPYGDKSVFVLSTRPLAAAPPGARVQRLSGSPAEVHAQLAARGLQHVYVDGGITIQGFLRAGLIQHLIVTRVPVLIGEGISLFGAVARDIPLKHITTRQYASGLVQSEYEVDT